MANKNNKDKYADPVCGMILENTNAKDKSSYNGAIVYFCSVGCKTKFNSDPKKYIPINKKKFWVKYLERLNKATGGRPPSCCG